MAKGYAYCVVAAKPGDDMDPIQNTLAYVDSSSFEGEEGSLSAEFFDDPNREDADEALGSFLSWATQAGFTVKQDERPDGCAFIIKTGDADSLQKTKETLFAPRWERVKKMVDEMPLSVFAGGSSGILQLQAAIEEQYGENVKLFNSSGEDTGTRTMDDFMRDLLPDTLYYVANAVVLQH